MAGKVRYLIERAGRYHARIVVPVRLRPIVGKVELTAPLGADRRIALRKLPAVVADFQDRLGAAERQIAAGKNISTRARVPRLLDHVEIARTHYAEAIAFDTELRDNDPRYAGLGSVDADHVQALRSIIAGRATTLEINHTIGGILTRFRHRGHHDHEPGSPQWRALARHLAEAELAALNVSAHRDEGLPDPKPISLLEVPSVSSERTYSASVRGVFEGYRNELQAGGKARDAERRWSPVIESMINFLGHEKAHQIGRRDAVRWKDHLLETLAPKTVRDSYVATARAAFGWAVDNEVVETNPFVSVRIRVARKVLNREKGFTDAEAVAVLKAARAYEAPSCREHATMVAAKRWTPFLAAYSGARIGEIAQLRAEDIREEGGIHYMRITPEAGSVKTDQFRDVPLHPHLIELGFLDLVASMREGPMFYRAGTRTGRTHPSRIVADRVAKWIRSLKVADANVQPNHGWRHRLKTVAREVGIDARVVDALQGHAPRTAGDSYGDVTLKTKHAAIRSLPAYQLKGESH